MTKGKIISSQNTSSILIQICAKLTRSKMDQRIFSESHLEILSETIILQVRSCDQASLVIMMVCHLVSHALQIAWPLIGMIFPCHFHSRFIKKLLHQRNKRKRRVCLTSLLSRRSTIRMSLMIIKKSLNRFQSL